MRRRSRYAGAFRDPAGVFRVIDKVTRALMPGGCFTTFMGRGKRTSTPIRTWSPGSVIRPSLNPNDAPAGSGTCAAAAYLHTAASHARAPARHPGQAQRAGRAGGQVRRTSPAVTSLCQPSQAIRLLTQAWLGRDRAAGGCRPGAVDRAADPAKRRHAGATSGRW